jgi:UDPglucose 6-dehydrogenase
MIGVEKRTDYAGYGACSSRLGMRLVVLGAGYVGLVTGTGLSDLGHEVLVYDIAADKVAQLRDGRIPIYEPGLADLIRRNQRSGRLSFATEISFEYACADAWFISVGTPAGRDGAADLTAVMAATDTIAKVARKDSFLIVKSTVPVGTCDLVQRRVAAAKVALEVVSNPEFLKEGAALEDFFKPDRVVIGAHDERAREFIRDLYAPLQLSGERVVMTDPRSSELIKYASNAMLAVRISFMNELSRLCHATGADIHCVRRGVGSDTRIGKKFLYAGPGYGGSCFPKDVQALSALGRAHGLVLELVEAAHRANEEQSHFVVDLVEKSLGGVMGRQIAIWGCSFKPETDDIRESPASRLTKTLLARGATVVAHDPEAGPNFAKHFAGRVTVKECEYDALDGSHALVLLTEWRSYRAPSFAEMRRRLVPSANGVAPVLVDARNVWPASEVLRAGLRYQGIGVPSGGPRR